MPLTELPFDLPGKVYRSPMPFGYFDLNKDTFEAYKANHIQTVIMLTSDEEALHHTGLDLRQFYQEAGLEVLHHPITDFSTPDDTVAFSDVIDTAILLATQGENIAIHCYAGVGRAGMFAALMARRILNMDGDRAIQWVRQHIPDAVQTPQQISIIMQNAGK